jgi:peptidoglycan hydrolase-like protein with peptidoglycan-binding domain
MRRWILIGGSVGLAAATATIGVAAGALDRNASDAPAATTSASNRNVAPVTRRDLARTKEFDGTVGYGTESPLALALAGTLTGVPTPGEIIDAGSVVAEIDGVPVIALGGNTPMWRDLESGVDDGADILALEHALQLLGYADQFDVTVDGKWTNATTRAVKAFQKDHGQPEDGKIANGEIVFIPGPLRIAEVGGAAGQQSSEAAIKVTSPDQVITVNLKIAQAPLLKVGDNVDVKLPDDSTVPGTVESIGEATTDQDGSTTLPVTVTVDGGVDLPIGSPVDVVVSTVAAEQVLTVPVEAVLAAGEGGFAVEVRDGTDTQLVRVELGVFADGFVEISGDVADGDEVVVP